MARHVLIIARADVADDFHAALESLHGGVHGRQAGSGYRLAAGTPGVTTHFVSHGDMPDRVWGGLVGALNSAVPGGVVEWEGKPGAPLSAAAWAFAYDGGELVAGFQTTAGNARQILAALDLAAVANDSSPF